MKKKRCSGVAKTTGKRCRRQADADDLCKQHAGIEEWGGRPEVEVDLEQLTTLAEMHCTHEEIAAVLKISPDTLSARFSEHIKRGRAAGKASLRRRQWRKSEKSAVMQIFLGKNYLGQTDKAVVGHVDLTKSWRARVEDSGAIVIEVEEEDDETPARATAALA